MGRTESYQYLSKVVHEVESNPDLTLFLMDVAEPGCPFIKIPLGEDVKKDGFLVIHDDGWFIDKEE